mmetsp:Transcript_17620/g.55206  ORF Transcript_17620/g.55206 Transcript_17620/m.55206 type:complete len:322 (+) Transcript_17620:1776-2741(+)
MGELAAEALGQELAVVAEHRVDGLLKEEDVLLVEAEVVAGLEVPHHAPVREPGGHDEDGDREPAPLPVRPRGPLGAEGGDAAHALAAQLQYALAAGEPQRPAAAAHGRLPEAEAEVRAAGEERHRALALAQDLEARAIQGPPQRVGDGVEPEHLPGADHVVPVQLHPGHGGGHRVVADPRRLRLSLPLRQLPQLTGAEALLQAPKGARGEPRTAPQHRPVPRLAQLLGELPRQARQQPLLLGVAWAAARGTRPTSCRRCGAAPPGVLRGQTPTAPHDAESAAILPGRVLATAAGGRLPHPILPEVLTGRRGRRASRHAGGS